MASEPPAASMTPVPPTVQHPELGPAEPVVPATAALCHAVLSLPRAVPGSLVHRLHAAHARSHRRLDSGPAFFLLLYALAIDLARIDATSRADVLVMTRKVAAIKAAAFSAAEGVEKLRTLLQEAEKRTSQVLGLKRAAARRLHRVMMGLPEEEGTGEGGTVDGSSGTTDAPEGGVGEGSPSAAAAAAAPLRPPLPVPNRAALARYSALLSSLDARVKDASATWRAALWEHTLADTRLSELQAAQSALMDQLVAVMIGAEADKAELRARMWRALVRRGVGKEGLLEK
jgi:hypothetical protein